jgi:hypothetical protein
MTHDPTRDCEHGRLKGKCDVCDLQEEVAVQSLQCAHCHVTIETLNDKAMYLIAENERLNKALHWEQNRAERIGTHGPGCHTWGPAHYECLLRVNAELVEALRVARHMIVEDGTPIGWSVDRLSEIIAKATGEQP